MAVLNRLRTLPLLLLLPVGLAMCGSQAPATGSGDSADGGSSGSGSSGTASSGAGSSSSGSSGPATDSGTGVGVDASAGFSTGTFAARRWFSSENQPLDDVNPAVTSPWNAGPLPLTYMLSEQAQVPITAPGGTAVTTIDVDPTMTYQSMLGFGISMEQASVANIGKLSATSRTELLTSLVDPVAGMGQNLFRVPMGTPDFTGTPWYSYDDMPAGQTDPTMAKFSIQNDIDVGTIGVLKSMLAINPDVKFFGSIWSPPGWMKDSGTMLGGNLVSSNIPALALYFPENSRRSLTRPRESPSTR